MRSLNTDELAEVHGGGVALKWAYRIGEWVSNAYTLYEASSKVEIDPSSYGAADAGGYNPMGDYTNGICLR